jgi:hypothetical protein
MPLTLSAGRLSDDHVARGEFRDEHLLHISPKPTFPI